jgi:hypothetical protein
MLFFLEVIGSDSKHCEIYVCRKYTPSEKRSPILSFRLCVHESKENDIPLPKKRRGRGRGRKEKRPLAVHTKAHLGYVHSEISAL